MVVYRGEVKSCWYILPHISKKSILLCLYNSSCYKYREKGDSKDVDEPSPMLPYSFQLLEIFGKDCAMLQYSGQKKQAA